VSNASLPLDGGLVFKVNAEPDNAQAESLSKWRIENGRLCCYSTDANMFAEVLLANCISRGKLSVVLSILSGSETQKVYIRANGMLAFYYEGGRCHVLAFVVNQNSKYYVSASETIASVADCGNFETLRVEFEWENNSGENASVTVTAVDTGSQLMTVRVNATGNDWMQTPTRLFDLFGRWSSDFCVSLWELRDYGIDTTIYVSSSALLQEGTSISAAQTGLNLKVSLPTVVSTTAIATTLNSQGFTMPSQSHFVIEVGVGVGASLLLCVLVLFVVILLKRRKNRVRETPLQIDNLASNYARVVSVDPLTGRAENHYDVGNICRVGE
jgi:hypothetical protein